METIFMNTENSKASEPYKFFLNLSSMLEWIDTEFHCFYIDESPLQIIPVRSALIVFL